MKSKKAMQAVPYDEWYYGQRENTCIADEEPKPNREKKPPVPSRVVHDWHSDQLGKTLFRKSSKKGLALPLLLSIFLSIDRSIYLSIYLSIYQILRRAAFVWVVHTIRYLCCSLALTGIISTPFPLILRACIHEAGFGARPQPVFR